jgi:hypothetical protein
MSQEVLTACPGCNAGLDQCIHEYTFHHRKAIVMGDDGKYRMSYDEPGSDPFAKTFAGYREHIKCLLCGHVIDENDDGYPMLRG